MDRDSLYILEEEDDEDVEKEELERLILFPLVPACAPIHRLARSGDATGLRQLLQACDAQALAEQLESRTSEGSTPLQVAAYYGGLEAVRTLQEFGASHTQRNRHGWHAGHYASRWSQPLDLRLAVGLRPLEAGRNSRSFAYRNIRDLRRKAATAAVTSSTSKLSSIGSSGGRLRTADSGICVCDSKEVLNTMD